MSFDNTKLLDFLDEIEKELTRKIVVVAVGGTAMTLLKAKPSTIDVDFTIPDPYYDDFQIAKEIVQPGFQVDAYHHCMVFITSLPEDYVKRSTPVQKTKLKKIKLMTLHPVDIIVTKIARLDESDEQDIESCMKKFKITKNQIVKRARQIPSLVHDKTFQTNLKNFLKKSSKT
ncbi:MAG: hypothetical protein KGH87_04015 [Thaumarchaeota archaeon]|nr:hypothetical protein [Nitrososphaerota archaeon]MDE1839066.1 hypothetical protein [Nitrososphaerota archaeon]